MYFYGEASAYTGPIDPSKINPNKCYLKHFDNFLFLDFVAKNGTLKERFEVEKEIVICKRKMAYWERHPLFSQATVQEGKERALKAWRQDKGKASAP